MTQSITSLIDSQRRKSGGDELSMDAFLPPRCGRLGNGHICEKKLAWCEKVFSLEKKLWVIIDFGTDGKWELDKTKTSREHSWNFSSLDDSKGRSVATKTNTGAQFHESMHSKKCKSNHLKGLPTLRWDWILTHSWYLRRNSWLEKRFNTFQYFEQLISMSLETR